MHLQFKATLTTDLNDNVINKNKNKKGISKKHYLVSHVSEPVSYL